jgi:hypothetical protein
VLRFSIVTSIFSGLSFAAASYDTVFTVNLRPWYQTALSTL